MPGCRGMGNQPASFLMTTHTHEVARRYIAHALRTVVRGESSAGKKTKRPAAHGRMMLELVRLRYVLDCETFV